MKKKILTLIILICFSHLLKAQWQLIDTRDVYGPSNIIITSGDSVYAVGRVVYFSPDDGITWDTINNGLPMFSVTSLAKKGNYLFAGTYNYGIFVSSNFGQSWTQSNNGLDSHFINDIVVKDDSVFIASNSGAYLSLDNGLHWTALVQGLIDTSVFAITYIGNRLLASTSSLLFASDNGGQVWFPTNLPDSLYPGRMAVCGNIVFVTTCSGIYRSADYGMNWILLNNGIPVTYFSSIVVLGNTIFIGSQSDGGGIYLSNDNGNSWISLGLSGYNIWSLNTSNHSLFAGVEPQALYKRPLLGLMGLDEVSDNNVKVYPNPSQGELFIEFGGDTPANAKFAISNALGQVLIKSDIAREERKKLVNTSFLASGVYFCRVYAGESLLKSEKVVKLGK